jgi:hypothetical protein
LKTALAIEKRLPGFFFWNGKKRYQEKQKIYEGPARTTIS